jgi:predicted porin
MKTPQLFKILLAGLLVLAFCLPASAAITLYDKDQTTFSVDGYFNVFYANSKSDVADTQQSRIKMGFLPNTIGFNFSKQVGDLKIGGRSSFWVTINDNSPTDTPIDVRQFYATIDGAFGQVLLGKDFGLFCRSNIFLDEILMGFGKTSSVDTIGVSFGNIGSGYAYPLPEAQITYRTPDLSGFKLAVGLFDPARTNSGTNAEESIPRLEAEATYTLAYDGGSLTAWIGGLTQTSKSTSSANVDSQGFHGGVKASLAGFSLAASGFSGEGIGSLGAFNGGPNSNLDATGYLVQGSYTIDKFRLVGSYGKSEQDIATGGTNDDQTIIGAVFYSLNSNVILVADYNIEETKSAGVKQEEIKTFALGAVVTF